MDFTFSESSLARNTTYADQIFELLKGKIIQNELKSGTILKSNSIAEELHVSVSPVRDAILKLETCGWARQCGKYKVVTVPDAKQLTEYLDIRLSLEILAFHLAHDSFCSGWSIELKGILEQAHFADLKNDPIEFILRSTDFHLFFAKKCGNSAVFKILSTICEQMLHANIIAYQHSASLRYSALKEHEMMTELLLHQEWAAYEDLLKSHIYKWPTVVSSVGPSE